MAKKGWVPWACAEGYLQKGILTSPERKSPSLQSRGEVTRQRTKMAAPSEGTAFAAGIEKTWGAVVRSPEGTPQKIRQLIDEGIAPEEGGTEA